MCCQGGGGVSNFVHFVLKINFTWDLNRRFPKTSRYILNYKFIMGIQFSVSKMDLKIVEIFHFLAFLAAM